MAEESQKESSTHNSQPKLAFECPFDLETVFTLQYSTEGLKGVLQWIIDNLGTMKGDINGLEKLIKSKVEAIDK